MPSGLELNSQNLRGGGTTRLTVISFSSAENSFTYSAPSGPKTSEPIVDDWVVVANCVAIPPGGRRGTSDVGSK
ncbi:MAG: hypothetical protein KAY65_07000 [Planctomycetes bacterium]|nr:hypothetical protein [Planctomycetota bacterium]